MIQRRFPTMILMVPALIGSAVLAAEPDLADYRTVENAITAKAARMAERTSGPGYLGIHLGSGKAMVAEVASESPAEKAGLKAGDLVLEFDGAALKDEFELREKLSAKSPGDAVKFRVERAKKPIDLTATLEAPSRPMAVGRQRATLGVQVAPVTGGEGARIEHPVSRLEPAAFEEPLSRLGAADVVVLAEGVDPPGAVALAELIERERLSPRRCRGVRNH